MSGTTSSPDLAGQPEKRKSTYVRFGKRSASDLLEDAPVQIKNIKYLLSSMKPWRLSQFDNNSFRKCDENEIIFRWKGNRPMFDLANDQLTSSMMLQYDFSSHSSEKNRETILWEMRWNNSERNANGKEKVSLCQIWMNNSIWLRSSQSVCIVQSNESDFVFSQIQIE